MTTKREDGEKGIMAGDIGFRKSGTISPSLREERVHHHQTTIKKDLNWWGIFSAGYTISSAWLTLAGTLTVSVPYGPANAIWGLLLVMPVYVCVSLSICELISAYPTTGGQYHWTSIIAPPRINKFASYLIGFLSWFSWICITASSSGGVALVCTALILSVNPEYAAPGWVTFLLYLGTSIWGFAMATVGKKLIGSIYIFGTALSLAAFTVCTVVTFAMARDNLQLSKAVWLTMNTESGWPSGVQFIICLSAPVLAFCPVDGAVHLVEEVKDARRVVPKAILASLVISLVTGLVFLLASMYGVSDFDALTTSSAGFSLFTIWMQATSSPTVTYTFSSVVMALILIGNIACQQVAGMITWSLGLDGAFIFRSRLSRIHPRINSPLWAQTFVFTVVVLLGLLLLFSSFAYNTIVGIASIAQQITLAAPIAFLMWRGRGEDVLPSSRPFRLRNWFGWFCNTVSMVFMTVTTVFFLFPTVALPDTTTMNYAIVVLAGSTICSTINWFFYARTRYHGPSRIQFHD